MRSATSRTPIDARPEEAVHGNRSTDEAIVSEQRN
jgi:hypothetical protein